MLRILGRRDRRDVRKSHSRRYADGLAYDRYCCCAFTFTFAYSCSISSVGVGVCIWPGVCACAQERWRSKALTSPRRRPSYHGPRKLKWIRTIIPRVWGPKYYDGNVIRTIRYGEIDATSDKCSSCMARTVFLIEPIHGEAGIVVPPTGYLCQVRELCVQENVMLTGDYCVKSEVPIRAPVGRTSYYA
jgi:hypothetical protein